MQKTQFFSILQDERPNHPLGGDALQQGEGLLHQNDIDRNEMPVWPRGKMNDINVLQVEKVRPQSRFLRQLPLIILINFILMQIYPS